VSALIIAHRGGAGLRPENTLGAFSHAIELGADGAELDVQPTRDGQVVVFHDFRLNPELCRDGKGTWLNPPTPRVVDLSYREIAGYDVGRARPDSDYARRHPDMVACEGARIPLLAQVAEIAVRAPKPFRLFIELKTSLADTAPSAAPETLADATLAVLRAAGCVDDSVLVGFDWRGLLHAKRIEPAIECWFSTYPQSWFGEGDPPRQDDPPSPAALAMLRHWARAGVSPWAGGFDAVNYGNSLLKAICAAGGDGWFPYARDATAAAIAEAHGLGLKVGGWTVDDHAEMCALAARGIDAICTDRPDRRP
jgi:glycerophosphoryl diester phosphodiesterase